MLKSVPQVVGDPFLHVLLAESYIQAASVAKLQAWAFDLLVLRQVVANVSVFAKF